MPRTVAERNHLFWWGCIFVRSGLVVLAWTISGSDWTDQVAQKTLQYVAGSLAVAAALGLIINMIRSKTIGALGGDVWWTWTRPVHSVLFLLYAWFAFQRSADAWIVLLVDVVLAICFGFSHQFFPHVCYGILA